jgi:AcrR family transcriptional regulator
LRGDILRAAEQLVDQAGAEAVTLRAVARRVGIAAPSIYPHFPDRDAILLAVAQDAFADLERQLRDTSDSSRSASDNLRATCAAYLDFARSRSQRYRVMFGAVWNAEEALQRFPERSQDLTRLGLGAFGALVDSVTACVDQRESTSADSFADATALWVGLRGLAELRVATPLFPWPPDLEDTLITRLALLRANSAQGQP